MKNLFDEIEYEGINYWISLVKWGFIRKMGYQFIKSNNRFESPSFTPECEVAVFTKRPSTGKLPYVVIYIADGVGDKAENIFNNVANAIKEKGLIEAANYVCHIKISQNQEFGKIYPENV